VYDDEPGPFWHKLARTTSWAGFLAALVAVYFLVFGVPLAIVRALMG
jgi:hypothetical protein